MGRGNEGQKALPGNPLFGPRPQRQADPRLKRQRNQQRRRHLRESLKQRHSASFHVAGEALLDGQPQPLLEMLEYETPRGMITVERRAVRDLIAAVDRHYAAQQTHINHADHHNFETLKAMQQLGQRARQLQLSRRNQERLRDSLIIHGHQLVNEELFVRLDEEKETIGPLPRIWFTSGDFERHLSKPSGGLVCEKPFAPFTVETAWNAAGRGQALPFEDHVSCPDCRQRFIAGETVDSYEPEQWLDIWYEQQGPLATYRYTSFQQLPYFDMPASELYDRLLDKRLHSIGKACQRLDIELPPRLKPAAD